MNSTYQIDAEGLEIFNKILRPRPDALRDDPGETQAAIGRIYEDLERRILAVLQARLTPRQVINAVLDTLEDASPLWFQWLRDPSVTGLAQEALPLTSHGIAGLVLDVCGVADLRMEIHDETRLWHEQALGEGHLVLGLPDQLGTRDYIGAMDTSLHAEHESHYLAHLGEGVPDEVRGLLEFSNTRYRYGFMRFPSDHPGYSPEIELVTGVLSCIPGAYADPPRYSSGLMSHVAKYLARITLCSAGHIVPIASRRGDGEIGRYPIPGEPGGRYIHNLRRMQKEINWYSRRTIGKLWVTPDDLARSQLDGDSASYLHVITS